MHAEPATTPRLRKDPAVDCYLDLIARMLTRTGFPDPVVVRSTGWKATVVASLQRQLARRGVRLVRPRVVPATGPAWPPAESAETMLSLARLENVRVCIETALEDGIAGDVVEAGVWRGGTTIYMRAVLAAYG
ncbi:MAG TPA: TylF/MycF/NovP-related O-methyltransferase, partial [Acidimicrobiia bacterium]